MANPEAPVKIEKRIVTLDYEMDLGETALYQALYSMNSLGDGAVVRAREGAMRIMAEINGHRHALGCDPIRFEPVHPSQLPHSGWWQVETDDAILESGTQ